MSHICKVSLLYWVCCTVLSSQWCVIFTINWFFVGVRMPYQLLSSVKRFELIFIVSHFKLHVQNVNLDHLFSIEFVRCYIFLPIRPPGLNVFSANRDIFSFTSPPGNRVGCGELHGTRYVYIPFL